MSKRTCHSELYEEENVPFRISNMSKRKRKFSFSEFESSTESRRVIDDAKSKLGSVDLTCATSDEFLAIMTLRYGASCATDLTSVATVVPVTCGSWREEIAVELFGLLAPSLLSVPHFSGL